MVVFETGLFTVLNENQSYFVVEVFIMGILYIHKMYKYTLLKL